MNIVIAKGRNIKGGKILLQDALEIHLAEIDADKDLK